MARMLALVVVLGVVAAVAATGPTWKATSFSASVAMGVSFADDTTGYISGGINGQGPAIWKSSDTGSTWAQVPTQNAAMFMAIGTNGDDAVASGFLSVEHTSNGKQFEKAGGFGAVGPAQSAEGFKTTPGAFGITGETLLYNGVGYSTNGGANFSISHAWGTNSSMAARYGSFPTSDTWYISAGTWPNKNSKIDQITSGVMEVTERLKVHKSGRFMLNMEPSAEEGYVAGIGKTTDGGKTWSTVFTKMNEFYFNGIDCADENNCVAVGEANSGAAPGARIYTTHDGGKTWTRTMFAAGAANSIMAARFVSPTEVWTAGGALDSAFAGAFYHSTDAGDTWTLVTADGMYATDLSFTKAGKGFATILLEDEQSGLAMYA